MFDVNKEYICGYDIVTESKYICGNNPRIESSRTYEQQYGVDSSEVAKVICVMTDTFDLVKINQVVDCYHCGEVFIYWTVSCHITKYESGHGSFLTACEYLVQLFLSLNTDGMVFEGDISILYATHLEKLGKTSKLLRDANDNFTVMIVIPIEFLLIFFYGSAEQKELCIKALVPELVDCEKLLSLLGYAKIKNVKRNDFEWKV